MLAAQALKAANVRISAMLGRVDKRKPRDREAVRAVGRALARVVLCRVRLLLDTECRRSPRRSTLTLAQQCLAQWEKLLRWRFTTQFEALELVRMMRSHRLCCLLGASGRYNALCWNLPDGQLHDARDLSLCYRPCNGSRRIMSIRRNPVSTWWFAP